MGSGIGAAIGMKLASRGRPVVAVCGDYGFQMYGMDLSTCVQERLGVTFVVMNDARMRMVEAGLGRNYGRSLPMDGPRVDFAAVARAHGARGCSISTLAELREALASGEEEVPSVLDVHIDPSAAFPVNARAEEISNFTAR
jgi:acetolactate synthase I/II/III large subunit